MPELTKEELIARLDALRQERQALIDQVNACYGAIQENERWLARLSQAQEGDRPATGG